MKFFGVIFAAAIFSSPASADAVDFATYAPRVTAVRIPDDEAPVIDGDLSDPAWSKAAVIRTFYQVEPVEGGVPTEPTIAYVMYDDKKLYFGFHLYESEPSRIRRTQLARDAELRDEDAIRIFLDPFGTFRNAYFFATNSNGAKIDALVENNSAFKREWNTIWDVKSRVVEDGWVAEFAIPFQSISLDPDRDEWNFQLLRTIPRLNQEIRWSNIDRSRSRIDLTSPGRLDGVKDISTGAGLEAQLFAAGATAYDWETGETDFSFDPSANIFYKITPGLTGSLTLNTDFADAPLDARQVNTGRFSLFFPETRDFFLQDAAAFEFGGRVFADSNVNGLPFFSRNIGIVEGRPVDLVAGAKISGNLGAANIGALAVRTGDDVNHDGQYLFAGRSSIPLLNESKAGVVFTHGDPTGVNDNTVAGVDFQYKNSAKYAGALFADFAYLRSFDSERGADHFASTEIAYRGLKWAWTTRFENIGEDYSPRLGFANRTGVRKYRVNAFHTLRPAEGSIRAIETGGFAIVVTDLDDKRLDSEFGGWTSLENRIGDKGEVEVFSGYFDIEEPFDIAGRLNVPVGQYQFTRYRVELESSNARPFSAGAQYRWGGIFGGDFSEISANASIRPGRHFNVGAKYSLTRFSLPSGDLDVHVGSVNMTVAISPDMFVKTDIQYDNISEAFTYLSRFTWEPTPEREIFISFGHAATIEEERFPESFRAQSSTLAIRLGHTFRI